MPELRTETMTVNMGPQHPSTHGVLRLVLELDGETVAVGRADDRLPAHRHREDRRAEEVAAGDPARRADGLPERAVQQPGVLPVGREAARRRDAASACATSACCIAELQRINSHLVWLGTHGMEVGAVSVMLYCFRERELLLNINEMLAGFRLFPSYMRVGGLREDLPRGFHDAVTRVPRSRSRPKLDEYEDLLTQERDLPEADAGRRRDLEGGRDRLRPGRADRARRRRRLRRPQVLSRISATRPTTSTVPTADRRRRLRALPGARRRDAREREDLPAGARADHADAASTRSTTRASRRRRRIKVYTEMEALIQHFLIYSQGFTVPAGEAYVPVEGPRGEQGFYVVSDGTNRPWRVKSRPPSLLACQALRADDRRRADCRRHRRDRIDRRRDGRRGPVSFHPKMAYGATLPQVGARSSTTRGRRSPTRRRTARRFDEIVHALSARAAQRSAVLPALYLVQDQQGYITANAMRHVAELLGITPRRRRGRRRRTTRCSTRKPVGKFVLQVCRTLSCALNGAERVTEELRGKLGIKPGETDASGTFTLLEVECLGACDRAPVVMVNDAWHERQRPESVPAAARRPARARRGGADRLSPRASRSASALSATARAGGHDYGIGTDPHQVRPRAELLHARLLPAARAATRR